MYIDSRNIYIYTIQCFCAEDKNQDFYYIYQEREKYNQEVTKWQKELQELQSQVVEENASKLRLQMELDSKDSEIEQLQGKLTTLGSETASLSSADNDDTDIYTQGFYTHI